VTPDTGVSRCRSCGAEIVWAITERGKRMPLDAEPSEAGTFVVRSRVEGERVVLHALYAPEAGAGLHHTSHFATCPQAGEWRR
jgi:hypothetical protein